MSETPKNTENGRGDSPEPAAIQGGNRVASITPQGEDMNQSVSERERVTVVPKTAGNEGQVWQGDAETENEAEHGGFMNPDPAFFPADRSHEGGDPVLDGDAQYGASPLRDSRYKENHEANQDIAEGKLKSGHFGAQTHYPTAEDVRGTGATGHDERQQSRERAQSRP